MCWNRFVSLCVFILFFCSDWETPVGQNVDVSSLTRALYAQTHRSGSCFWAPVVSYDDINVIFRYVFKQHLNVHKPHDFFCSLLHLASCSGVNISTRFFSHVLGLGEGLLLVCVSMRMSSWRNWKWREHCFVFSFLHVWFVSLCFSLICRLY